MNAPNNPFMAPDGVLAVFTSASVHVIDFGQGTVARYERPRGALTGYDFRQLPGGVVRDLIDVGLLRVEDPFIAVLSGPRGPVVRTSTPVLCCRWLDDPSGSVPSELALAVAGGPRRALAEHRRDVARWLTGRKGRLPGYLGPPAPETQQILTPLLALNRTGRLTVESQPGRRGRVEQRAHAQLVTSRADAASLASHLGSQGMLVDTWFLGSPPAARVRYPITSVDGRAMTWTLLPGASAEGDPDSFVTALMFNELRLAVDSPRAVENQSWCLTVVDPGWGGNALWRLLEAYCWSRPRQHPRTTPVVITAGRGPTAGAAVDGTGLPPVAGVIGASAALSRHDPRGQAGSHQTCRVCSQPGGRARTDPS